MTRDEAIQHLQPKWQVIEQQRRDRSWLLKLDTGHEVEVDDSGAFHVSGPGWKTINRRLHEAQWPNEAVQRAAIIRQTLEALPIAQQRYFSEGLHCIQYARAPRAAIVLGWAGFMDALHRRLASELQALQPKYAARFPKLSERHRLNDLATVRELDDWQALDLGLEMAYYAKSLLTQLNAMRDQRNHCAHIEEYPVTIEMALFFYASIANYTGQLASTP